MPFDAGTDPCGQCAVPGACCRRIALWGEDTFAPNAHAGNDVWHWLALYGTQLDALVQMAEMWLPFLPDGKTQEGWQVFSCPVLGRDGRCTDYENRPDVCRRYQAGAGGICVHSPDFEAWDVLTPAETERVNAL